MECNARLGRMSVLGWALLLAITVMPVASAQIPQKPSRDSAVPPTIVVGFVGGFVRSDDDRRPEVQIIQRLSKQKLPAFHAAAFENRRRAKARQQIMAWLDTDGDGHLSVQEKQNARIILFGHSWGGSAVIRLAQELEQQDIPILLTIQVDSINKGWSHDCVIPANVAQAAYFYQTRGLVHGCQTIHAEDSHRTRIIGRYEFEYTEQPSGCRSYPWFDRHIFRTHNAMECDPRVWSKVEDEIQTQLQHGYGAQVAAGGH